MTEEIGLPFTRIMRLDGLPSGGATISLEANEEARAEIARRLDAPSIERLSGAFALTPARDGVLLSGRVEARLTRRCVASLDLLEEPVAEDFEIEFSREAEAGDALDFDPDAPEPLESDTLDLAEILVQQLSLAMDPYPRRGDASSLAESYGHAAEATPFAALRGAFTDARDKE